MKAACCMLLIVLVAVSAFACEALEPKNPVKTAAVCGRVEGPDGKTLGGFGLKLIRKDQTPVSEMQTDEAGNFRFASLEKGDYYMVTNSRGWAPLGWPVMVTSSKALEGCRQPLIVRPSLVCGGSISKKGYRPRF